MANKTKSRQCSASESTKNENSDMRKLRNRISQKAFRTRQAMRMKELEERLHNGTYSDAELATHLQDQNAALRKQLLECHKKFVSLQLSMKGLVNASALALGIESLDGDKEVHLIDHNFIQPTNDSGKIESTSGRTVQHCKSLEDERNENPVNAVPNSSLNKRTSHVTSPDPSNNSIEELSKTTSDDGEFPRVHYQADDHEQRVPDNPATNASRSVRMDFTEQSDNQSVTGFNLDYFSTVDCTAQFEISDENQLLAADSRSCAEPFSLNLAFSEDLGPLKYKYILETSPSIACRSFKVKRTNSPFSDHIDALGHCIGWSCSRWSTSPIPEDKISSSIGSILLTFVSMSWQSMTAWHTYTKAHVPLRQLMAWRVCSTPDRYANIVPSYQPTKLQMTVPHPSIIDWIPWPQLRDNLIIHHSANPCLDSIICDIGNSYVVRADLSLLIRCPQPVLGYLGVWDLVRAIAPEATGSPESSTSNEDTPWQPTGCDSSPPNPAPYQMQMDSTNTNAFENWTLPARDAKALFSSRELATQAFKVLGLDQGAFNFRLDPAFFGRHPELYHGSVDLMAQGVALRPSEQISISAPRELDVSVVGQYQEMSRYLIDLALEPQLFPQPF